MNELEKVNIMAFSGPVSPARGLKSIERLRRGFYCKVASITVPGDAPKDFIRIYEYGQGVFKRNANTWPAYIAKVGHKWYPVESITEYLLNRIGCVIGIDMSFSKLMLVKNQVRFLSKYFLESREEILVHGADIFAGHLQDKALVEEIELKGMAREFYTFQFVELSIEKMFPAQKEEILLKFVEMLFFDAVVGNNDRHFYNWGVVLHLRKRKTPTFAPVYDTARGLFWNKNEEQIEEYFKHPKQIGDRIATYARKSQPKIGWEGMGNINHFQLIEKIYQEDYRYRGVCEQILRLCQSGIIEKTINKEFSNLISPKRLSLIRDCIMIRIQMLSEIVK